MQPLLIADEIDQEFSKWWVDQTRWNSLLTDEMREVAALAYATGREQGQRDTRELLDNRLRAAKEDSAAARREAAELKQTVQVIENVLRR